MDRRHISIYFLTFAYARNRSTNSRKDGWEKIIHEQSEYIRIQAVKQVRIENKSPEEVIKTFGLHRANIYKWLAKYDAGGFGSLKSTIAKGHNQNLRRNSNKNWLATCLKTHCN
ncbi:MAG: helix-turn-helix domain-containing protein [Sphingobacteriales bacterium]|nr:helix-turn-helix domain-containing protein [Sphingobacteriales bacterium]